jgi:CheY-like chemotaxis protein
MDNNRKLKILCAEDENEIRENIAEILRDEGFEVFEAENGKKGYELFLKFKPDLVISDIMMPEVDGYGLLKMVRETKNSKAKTTPFIFLSALGQKENVIKGVELSANDYLVKPIDFDMMIVKVKEKTSNALKVEEAHQKGISNIKSQVSKILPSQLYSYVDVIIQTSSILKESPYGDFLSTRTIDDINRIYLNAIKLKGAINNYLDESVIDSRINSDEEIFSCFEILAEIINSLTAKIKERIDISEPFEVEKFPKIKAEKEEVVDSIRKILALLLKIDLTSRLEISMMIDHLEQIVIVFYIKSNNQISNLIKKIDEEAVNKFLSKISFQFRIINEESRFGAVITIPTHRLI